MNYFKTLGTVFLYYLVLSLAVVGYFIITKQINIIRGFDFLNWDAEHVNVIRMIGYDFTRAAFYPLFPFFWKMTQLGPMGISILNGVIFIASFSYFLSIHNNGKFKWLFLSFPVVFFMFLPYSESLLFAFTLMFYLGLKSDNLWLSCLAVFLMSCTKPTIGILIPGIVISEIIAAGFSIISLRRIFYLMLSALLANILVLAVQWSYVGDFLAFFKAQSAWGNNLSWPNVPFTTWNQSKIIWIDTAALWISFVSGAILAGILLKSYLKKEVPSRALVYSLTYLAGTGAFIVFFRGGQLFSINRFIFTSGFLYIAFAEAYPHLKSRFKYLPIFLFLGFIFFSFLVGSYQHIKLILKFSVLAGFLTLWTLTYLNYINRYLKWLPILLSFCCQVCLTIWAIEGEWIA